MINRTLLMPAKLLVAAIALFLLRPAHGDEASGEEDAPRNWLLAPVIASSPSFGDGLGLSGFYFFRLDREHAETPPSRIFTTAIYSNTDSWFAVVAPSLYLADDTQRWELPLAAGRVNNELEDFATGGTARFASDFTAFQPSFRYRLWERVFIGAQLQISDIAFSPEDAFSKDYLERVGAEDATQVALGALLTYDSRDHQLYPYTGSYAELNYLNFPDAFGNEFDYDVLESEFKNFVPVRLGTQTLAWRLYGRFTFGDTTYAGKATLGRFSDLRGYTSGEIVGENLMTAQAEYRWNVWKRLSLVPFAGISAIYDGSMKNIDSDAVYGSFGLGFRVLLMKAQRVHLRIDFAKGDGDDAYYVSLREAF